MTLKANDEKAIISRSFCAYKLKCKDKKNISIGNIETREGYKLIAKDISANASKYCFVEISYLTQEGEIVKRNIVGKKPT